MAFWEEKTLDQMTETEWEALCDGCGRCCLLKLEDEDTGILITSDVRCQLLDGDTCGCTDYPNRQAKVPDCIKLTLQNVTEIPWIPKTCAYRRISEGKGLAWWHPLVSGDPQTACRSVAAPYSKAMSNPTPGKSTPWSGPNGSRPKSFKFGTITFPANLYASLTILWPDRPCAEGVQA